VAVFVDDMTADFGRMKMCQCIADTPEELHAMMDKIGVQRKWYQVKASGDHYDISRSKRALAIKHGAIEITVRQLAGMCRRFRDLGYMGDPATAEKWIHTSYEIRDL
jgi:hypothetical protein